MLSMGEYPHTPLELARKKTLDARALLAQNVDLSADRVERAAQVKLPDANTFEAVAKVWFGKQTVADSTRVRDGRILGYLYKELGSTDWNNRRRDTAGGVREHRGPRHA